MTTENASHSRLVTIDGNGWLHPTDDEPIDIVADRPFAVSVLWTLNGGTSWVGWLATSHRRFARFTAADLEDVVFANWLRALPGWDQARLWRATTTPGLYLVWRRETTIEPPRLTAS